MQSEIKKWIVENYLSQKEIEEILQIKPSFSKNDSDTKEVLFKKLLYVAIVSELSRFIENKHDYFIKCLESLMKGLPFQIDIKKEPSDDVKLKNTQELIEEKILPLLTELSDNESSKAQKILNLTSA